MRRLADIVEQKGNFNYFNYHETDNEISLVFKINNEFYEIIADVENVDQVIEFQQILNYFFQKICIENNFNNFNFDLELLEKYRVSKNENIKVKIELDEKELNEIIEILEKKEKFELIEKIKKSADKYKKILRNKQKSTTKATLKRIEEVKNKITNAVEQLKKEGKEINNYSVSQIAKISYNTARKYSKFIKELANN